MTKKDHHHHEEDEELELLRKQVRDLIKIHLDERQEIALLREIRDRLPLPASLAYIRIRFRGGSSMPLGPVTLAVGQSVTATVQGFDQNGAPFVIDFTANPVTWSVDQPSVASSTPNPDGSDAVVGVSAGVANLTASCAGFTDTETVTVAGVTPVLSSIKINFV